MRKKLHVSVIFNEPTVLTAEGRKFISESGMIQEGAALENARAAGLVDMSEVGVIEEREQIQTALGELGYQTSIFNMSNNIDKLLEFLKAEKPDLIFNLVESLGDQASTRCMLRAFTRFLKSRTRDLRPSPSEPVSTRRERKRFSRSTAFRLRSFWFVSR